MQKIFLDANFFIDFLQKRKNIDINDFKDKILYVSALTIHIFIYVFKIKIPDKNLTDLLSFFNLAKIDNDIVINSLQGPTDDFEDNIQLHCASSYDCDFFLTSDKNLLKMKFFGEVRIVEKMI